jgi:hypothetical protein
MGAGNVTPVLISGDNSNIQGSVICSGAVFRREKVLGDPRRPARSRMTPTPSKEGHRNFWKNSRQKKTSLVPSGTPDGRRSRGGK